MNIGVLPEIDGREMEAENIHGALQDAQPSPRHDACVGLPQRKGMIARSALNSAADA